MSAQAFADGLERLLGRKEWTEIEPRERFRRFAPPPAVGMSEHFELLLPMDPNAHGGEDFMLRTVFLLAELYHFDREDLALALTDDATVFATRVMDESAKGGDLPLDRFEALVDRLKKVCLSAATSVLTEDPLQEDDPPDATEFVRSCSFLQTRNRSFESRIKLPNTFALGRDLVNQEGIPGAQATERIRESFGVVVDEVLERRDYIYHEDFIAERERMLHIPLLRNIGLMLKETAFTEFEFRFIGVDAQERLRPPRITASDVRHVNNYVKFLKDKLAAHIPIDVSGKVTELRSQDIKSSNNHVRVRGYNREDGREVELALSLGRASYLDAWSAHGRGETVTVVGNARRLKSYYRVDDLRSFEVRSR